MGKKEKKFCALSEEFQAMINLVPKLEELLSIHREIAEGYQKFRKNGGAAIPGIEKHLSCKETEKAPCCKTEEVVSKKEAKPAKETKVPKKQTKGKNKVNVNSVDPINDAGTVT